MTSPARPKVPDIPWLAEGCDVRTTTGEVGWSISSTVIMNDPGLCLDPKRLSEKFLRIQEEIAKVDHFRLGDAVGVIDQLSGPELGQLSASAVYRYVEIQDVGPGTYDVTTMRGWQLPTRARHLLDPGDLMLGGIWGSVTKWFVAGHEENLIATNGFHRCKVLDKDLLIDLVVGLCSEAYAVQARALSRGSDGLAEVTADDIAEVLLPKITDETVRKEVGVFLDAMLEGHTSTKATVQDLIKSGRVPIPDVPPRPSHVVLV